MLYNVVELLEHNILYTSEHAALPVQLAWPENQCLSLQQQPVGLLTVIRLVLWSVDTISESASPSACFTWIPAISIISRRKWISLFCCFHSSGMLLGMMLLACWGKKWCHLMCTSELFFFARQLLLNWYFRNHQTPPCILSHNVLKYTICIPDKPHHMWTVVAKQLFGADDHHQQADSNDEWVLRHIRGLLGTEWFQQVPQGALCWFPHHTLMTKGRWLSRTQHSDNHPLCAPLSHCTTFSGTYWPQIIK